MHNRGMPESSKAHANNLFFIINVIFEAMNMGGRINMHLYQVS